MKREINEDEKVSYDALLILAKMSRWVYWSAIALTIGVLVWGLTSL